MLNKAQLCGQDEGHIVFDENGVGLHPNCHTAWRELQNLGQQQGFDLQVFSGFRSYDRQLMIWNAKATGGRAVRDDDDQVLAVDSLSEIELVHAILRFSMLPGASRHHWGTDLDVVDAAAMADDYRVQLTLAEVSQGGIFAPVHEWLDELMTADRALGFFRPYAEDRGGISPERWHLSFKPLARHCEERLSLPVIEQLVTSSDMVLKERVLELLPEIYQRYVMPA